MIDYEIRIIEAARAKKYIRYNHYSRGSHNGPSPCFGLFDNERLIGCCMFAIPCSERVRSSFWGQDNKDHVIELHRLHILDVTPKNTESWFISRCLKTLKLIRPEIWGVVSFSDSTEGHSGVIYKASNAYRLGDTNPTTFYLDQNGRLRHPRQSGKNITLNQASQRQWKPIKRSAKTRYFWLLPDSRSHKKWLINNCLYDLKNQQFH